MVKTTILHFPDIFLVFVRKKVVCKVFNAALNVGGAFLRPIGSLFKRI